MCYLSSDLVSCCVLIVATSISARLQRQFIQKANGFAQEEMIYVHHRKIQVSVSIDPIYPRNKARPKIFDD